MAKRIELDAFFLNMLSAYAERGTCKRAQQAAIIADWKGRLLSAGFNGVPSGLPHCTEHPCLGANDPKGDSSRCLAIHAEINAIIQCHRLDLAQTLYTQRSPCFGCAKVICNTGIERVVFEEYYTDVTGVELLDAKGIVAVRFQR